MKGTWKPLGTMVGSLTLILLLLLVACAPAAVSTPTAALPAPPTATRPPAPQPTTPAGAPTPTAVRVAPTATRVAVAPTQAPATPTQVAIKRGGVLQQMYIGVPSHYDYHQNGGEHNSPADMVREKLIDLNSATGEPIPALAESWKFEDPTHLVMNLRKGVKWQNIPPLNGRELVASDVVWSLERQRTPGAKFSWGGALSVIDKMEVVDKYTVRFSTKVPGTTVFVGLGGPSPILPKDVIDTYGPDGLFDFMHQVGAGPFMVKSITPGVGAEVKANPDYWQKGLPYMDGVKTTLAGEQTTVIAALRTGRIDWGPSESAGVTQFGTKTAVQKTNPKILWYSIVRNWVSMIDPAFNKPPFNDIRVRKALFLAADREEAIQITGEGGGHVSGPMSWKLFPGYVMTEEDLRKEPGYRKPKDQDIAEAKRLLAEAGYPNGLKLEAEATEYFTYLNKTNMEVVAQQWKKIGVDVTIKMYDLGDFFQIAQTGKQFLRSRGYSAEFDPYLQWSIRHTCKGSRNYVGYCNPAFDAKLDQAVRELDINKKKQMFREMERMLLDDYVQVWLFVPEVYEPVQPWVKFGCGQEPATYSGSPCKEEMWLDR